jgi:autotransporter-associated beta strand protein
VLAGTAGLTKSGPGTADLGGTNTYSGSTTISGGTLSVSSAGGLGDAAGAVTVNTGATLYTAGGLTISRTGDVTVNGGNLTTDNNNFGTMSVSGGNFIANNAAVLAVKLAGTAGLTVGGAGETYLWTDSSYTGATVISSGQLTLGGAGAISNQSRLQIDSGAAVNLTGAFAPDNINRTFAGLTGAGVLYGGGGTVTVNKTSGTDTFSGDIQGAQGFIKDGAGTLALVGNSSYTGTTTVNQGTLAITTGNALGSTAAGTTVANGARLLLSPTTGNITVGNEALTISGTGSSGWVLRSATGANTWGGKVTLATDSIIQAASGSSLALDVATGDAVDLASFTATFNGAGTHLINDPVVGTGGVTKAGSGILTLTGNSTYSGATTVSLGTLSIGSGGTSGSITGDIVNNASLIFNRSDALTYSGSIGGSGGLSKAGDGMLTLTGNSGYAGATAVDVGGLLVNGVHTGVGLVSVASGARFGGDGSLGGDLTLGVQAQFVFNSAATLDVAGAVTLDNSFSVGSLVSANGSAIDWGSIADGTYTLINTTSTFNNISNFGAGNAADIGGGRTAYFQNGSLQLVVVPEPSTFVMLGCIAACGGLLLRRRRASVAGQR